MSCQNYGTDRPGRDGESPASTARQARLCRAKSPGGVRYAEADTLVRLGEAYRAAGDDAAAVEARPGVG